MHVKMDYCAIYQRLSFIRKDWLRSHGRAVATIWHTYIGRDTEIREEYIFKKFFLYIL